MRKFVGTLLLLIGGGFFILFVREMLKMEPVREVPSTSFLLLIPCFLFLLAGAIAILEERDEKSPVQEKRDAVRKLQLEASDAPTCLPRQK